MYTYADIVDTCTICKCIYIRSIYILLLYRPPITLGAWFQYCNALSHLASSNIINK